MEETKYYTPTIEEFHVGFEYEVQQMEELCGSLTYTEEYASFNYEFGDEINLERVRVKCLDQEDIESFGFKAVELRFGAMLFSGSKYNIAYFPHSKMVSIYLKGVDIVFKGNIKNKSELKRVLQQIDI